MPKEEQLETAVRQKKISIGIPNDKKNDEKRVALTPEAVNILVESDNEVVVQKGQVRELIIQTRITARTEQYFPIPRQGFTALMPS